LGRFLYAQEHYPVGGLDFSQSFVLDDVFAAFQIAGKLL